MKVKAYAKLNLSLNVYQKVGEFHAIDSLATTVDLYDVVTLFLRTDGQIFVDCPGISPQENIAFWAAVEFGKLFPFGGCDISIQKNIPIGAGLGGSSADAAAVIFCLCKLLNISTENEKVQQLCAALGSDITFMLKGGFCRMMGKGDSLFVGLCPPKLWFAVTTFNKCLSTKEVYNAWDKLSAKSNFCDNERLFFDIQNGNDNNTDTMQNNLQAAARSVSDYAEDYISFCNTHNLLCRMTGSGSAYFTMHRTLDGAKKDCELLNSNGFSTAVYQSVDCGVEVVD